jgi:hypothetical protein
MAGPNTLFTDWLTGDIITAQRLNLMKNAIPVAGEVTQPDIAILVGGSFAGVTTKFSHRQIIGNMCFQSFHVLINNISGLSGVVEFTGTVTPLMPAPNVDPNASAVLGIVHVTAVTGTDFQRITYQMTRANQSNGTSRVGLSRGTGGVGGGTDRVIQLSLNGITTATSGAMGFIGNLAYMIDTSV